MVELRLVPPAVMLWAVTLLIIGTRTPWWATILVIITGVAIAFWDQGLALATTIIGLLGVTITSIRVARVDTTTFTTTISGTAARPTQPTTTGWIQHFHLPGYPTTMPVLSCHNLDIPVGAQVELHGNPLTSDSFGLNHTLFLAQSATQLGEPTAIAQWAAWVRDTFLTAVQQHTTGAATALIPAMVLGDTTAQTTEFKHQFIATGLAHLSAVSGANVAIVTTFASLLVARRSPRIKAAAAALALLLYVTVVGPDASVLRAAATGIIGLVVMLSASVKAPIHSLATVVIGLLLWDSSLAAHYGFILSVAATGGIIAAFPALRHLIGRSGIPDIIVRALAVSLAAYLVTMPIVALMNHHISVVAVAANLLAAPVVAPITVVGLIAAVISLLPGGLETIPLNLIEPLADWIGLVARLGAWFPGATITIDSPFAPAWAALLAGWIIWLLRRQHFRLILILLVCALMAPGISSWSTAHRVDPATLVTRTVRTKAELITLERTQGIPPDTQLIIIEEPPETGFHQRRKARPWVTRGGIPVVIAGRDVYLYRDGTQHAVDGSF